MKIRNEYRDYDGAMAWEVVVEYAKGHKEITTVTGKNFVAAYDTVRGWEDINTGNVKPYIKRQQTPFIALLHCAGILE